MLLQTQFDAGGLPDFLPETAHVRDDKSWQGPPPMKGLEDRRVEITGPVDRKMVINALNSGAATFMADFEGQLGLRSGGRWAGKWAGLTEWRWAGDRRFQLAHLAQQLGRAGQLARCCQAHHLVHRS